MVEPESSDVETALKRAGCHKQHTSNWEFRGDLWLRRGSLMVIQGDLRVTSPAAWDGWEFKPPENLDERPTGRVVLEEGATLIVNGSAEIEGTPENGSIMVAAPYGGAPMLSSSVLVKNDLKLRYGVHSGVLIADLVGILGKQGPALAKIQGTIKALTSRFAPHLSKLPLIGPFNFRKCWYADFATTLVFIPELVEVGLQGPWPIPLPNKNCLKTPFKAVSIGYAVNLSLWLGEHLLTQSKMLWPWGKGVVPVFTKIDAQELATQLNELPMDEIQAEGFNEGLEALVKEILPELVIDFATEILKEAVLEALNPINDGCGKSSEKEPKGFKKLVKKATETIALIGKLKKVWGLYSKTRSKINQYVKAYVMRKFRATFRGQLPLKEVGGAFLFAGGSLEVGGTDGNTPLAAGFFVAGHKLTVNANVMVGTLMSIGGDIKARKLYAFPYFSKVSIYTPRWLESFFLEAWQCPIPVGPGKQFNIGRPVYHTTAHGWERLER